MTVLEPNTPDTTSRTTTGSTALAIGYVLVATAGILLTRETANVAAVWPANVLVLAVLVRTSPSVWIPYLVAFCVANFGVNVWFGDNILIALGFVLCNGVEILTSAVLVRLTCSSPFDLANIRHLLAYAVCAAIIGPLLAATFGAAMISRAFDSDYWTVWWVWWTADAMGMLLLGPLFLTWSRQNLAMLVASNRAREKLTITILSIVLCALLFSQSHFPLLYLLVPTLLWASLRLGYFGYSFLSVLVATIGIVLTTQGYGPIPVLVNTHPSDAIPWLQLFLGVTVLPPLMVAITLAGRDALEARLRKNEALYRDLAEAHKGVVVNRWLPDGTLTFVGPQYCELIGHTRSQLLGRVWPELKSPGMRESMIALVKSLKENPRVNISEECIVDASGTERWFHWTDTPIRDSTGQLVEYQAVGVDISERKLVESELRANQAELRAIFDNAGMGIAVVSLDDIILDANQTFLNLLGYTLAEVQGNKMGVLTHGPYPETDVEPSIALCEGRKSSLLTEKQFQHSDGSLIWGRMTMSAVRGNTSEPLFLIAMIEDVTAKKQAEAQIHRLAYFDALTGLANRPYFRESAERALASARANQRQLAFLFLDLDNFKGINDTFGHEAGDLLLKEIAERLITTQAIANNQNPTTHSVDSTAARLGGDEFVAMIDPLTSIDDAGEVAKQLLRNLSEPIQLNGNSVNVTPSIGIAVFPNDGDDVSTLFRHADNAMYHAKTSGKAAYRYFSSAMNASALRRSQMEAALRNALDNGELRLVYQPQLDLVSNSFIGVEALLRWENEELGAIGPNEFIPLAEDTGLIVPIGAWVLKTACLQMKEWRSQALQGLTVAVNLSARQFAFPGLIDLVSETLANTGLEPSALEVELTEGMLIRDVDQAIQTMSALKALGVKLAIDDFGTGYASLSYLKRFPIDRLKIDRTFVQDLTVDPENAAIVRAIISLARSLRLTTIAEGVESLEQRAFLKRMGCDAIQGYLISRPSSPQEIGKIISQRFSVLDAETADDSRLTVLLVDDEVNITAALTRLLRRRGYRVLSVTNAIDALGLLAQIDVDVIISDHEMPGMSGTELLKRVHKLHPSTVRILLSGRSTLENLGDAINEGAIYKYLSKPVGDEMLLDTLRDATRLRDTQPLSNVG